MPPEEDTLRALVTGGTGFIGSHLVDTLTARDWEVVVVDRHASPFYTLPAGVTFAREEVNNRGALAQALEGVDVVFHLAWSGVHFSSNQDLRSHAEINLLPTLSLFELSLNAGVRRIVFISSGGTVYGKALHLPIDEEHPKRPLSAYGVTKLAAEQYLEVYGHLHGLEYVILRPSVPFGERQNPHSLQGAVAVFMGRLLHGEPIEIWGDGTQVRDFFYVGDLAEACWRAAVAPAGGEICNIGGGAGLTLNQLIERVQSVTGRRVPVVYLPRRPFDVPEVVLDIRKAARHLDWQPRAALEDGLVRTWQWIQSNAS